MIWTGYQLDFGQKPRPKPWKQDLDEWLSKLRMGENIYWRLIVDRGDFIIAISTDRRAGAILMAKRDRP